MTQVTGQKGCFPSCRSVEAHIWRLHSPCRNQRGWWGNHQAFAARHGPIPLNGGRWVDCDDGERALEGPHGERCTTTAEAVDVLFANQGFNKDAKVQLTMLQKFLNECCSEQMEVETEGNENERGR